MKEELKQELKAEINQMVESFLETEKIFVTSPEINGITVDFLYQLPNGVDIKLTIGRNLKEE